MAIIMGLDVSTSVTGLSIVDSSELADAEERILLLDRIEFGKFEGDPACKTLWDKADRVKQHLQRVKAMLADRLLVGGALPERCLYARQSTVDRVVLEEPLMGFRPGMSSAQTISQLMRFNGIVSYVARDIFNCEPEYIGSGHARKLCGIKLQRTAVGGPQKEQVFAHMATQDLRHVAWPVKKNGRVVDWSRDACDAYVIARAAMHQHVPPKVV